MLMFMYDYTKVILSSDFLATLGLSVLPLSAVIGVVLSLGLRRFRRERENLTVGSVQGSSGIVTAGKSEAGVDGTHLELINLNSSKVLSNHIENSKLYIIQEG